MPNVTFYQTKEPTPASIEAALPALLEKVLAGGYKAVVRCENRQRLEQLDDALWNFEKTAFLPHDLMEEGKAKDTPIALTSEPENPNQANILITISGASAEDKDTFERVLDIFEGNDVQRTAARTRWKTFKQEGAELAYFANEGGRWVKKG